MNKSNRPGRFTHGSV